MDPRYTGEVFKHLEKQNELLMEAHNSMSHELHKLQVEEEMLMRKFYDLMAAQGWTKKNEGSNKVSDGQQIGQATPFLTNTSNVSDGDDIGHSNALSLLPVGSSGEQR